MAKYRIPVEETFSWQRPVKNVAQATAPELPAKGDRYIMSAKWDEDGGAGKIAWHDGSGWKFDTPQHGWAVINETDASIYIYITDTWTKLDTGAGDMFKSTYDTDADGIVDAAEALNDGVNTVTAAQAKTAYDARGQWDGDLGCIIMNL